MTDKIDTPDSTQGISNVIYLNTSYKARRAAAKPRRRSKYYWSSKKTEFVEFDLRSQSASEIYEEFGTDGRALRIYFEDFRSAQNAVCFFRLMSSSRAQFVNARPNFDAVLHVWEVEAGRFFVASIDRHLYFYCESKEGIGLQLMLQFPANGII